MADNQEPELKAGHPPAVKVAGGMRVTQHKPPHLEHQAREAKKSESETDGTTADGSAAAGGEDAVNGDKEAGDDITLVEKNNAPKDKVIISGALAKGDADFPPEAVKAFHEKPVPSHEFQRNPPNKPNMHINQPRKQ